MGMYTEFHFNVKLKKDVPEDVIEVLRFMTADRDKPERLPNHPLFRDDTRWGYMLTCDSYYFPMTVATSLLYDNIAKGYFLSVRSNFKNYNNEIDKFLNWIIPYVADYHDNFLGFYRYEEAEEPTLIYLSDYREGK